MPHVRLNQMSLSKTDAQQLPRSDHDDEVSHDDLFQVLSNPRRRYAVHLLEHEAETVELGSMASQIAAWENDQAVGEVTGAERKRVYTSLQQQHLPKMDELGIVEFNKNRGTVEPAPALEDVDLYLDVVSGKEIPWSEYYLGLSFVCAALVATVGAGVWPLTALSNFSWMVFIVVVFSTSAIAHNYYTYEMGANDEKKPPTLRDQ